MLCSARAIGTFHSDEAADRVAAAWRALAGPFTPRLTRQIDIDRKLIARGVRAHCRADPTQRDYSGKIRSIPCEDRGSAQRLSGALQQQGLDLHCGPL